jgi:hypothetical protein
MTTYAIKPHSGQSVYKWRVYATIGKPGFTHQHQLAKCRTFDAAERVLVNAKQEAVEREARIAAFHARHAA